MTDHEKEAIYQRAIEHLANKEFNAGCDLLKQIGNYKDVLELLEMYYELCQDHVL
ncbi:MAG: hypothetical protein R6W96_04935 [Clostridia bacterium]